MSHSDFPKRWFLELDGKRMGPFSPEQVLGLLADGEIPENLRVLPDPKLGQVPGFEGSMTASALREAYYQDDRIPVAPAAAEIPYAPEPTPSDQIQTSQAESEQDLATTRRLFDLFQSAKEKRAARFSPSVSVPARSNPSQGSRSKLISSVAAALVVCTVGAWGLTRNKTESGADREIAAKTKASDDQERESRELREFKDKKKNPLNGSISLNEPSRQAPPPVTRPKPAFRNSWTPGKAMAKIAPPPREERRDDRREDRRDDYRDDRDRNDERNLDQWNQAQDPAANLQQSASAPLLNQMGGDAGIQPPPPVNAPAGVPLDGVPQDPNQAPAFTEQPAQ